MVRRWLRLFVAVATALAAWVVATPAHAAAPLCDQRGATTFAPAPLVLFPETSIDVGAPLDDQCAAHLAHAASADSGQTPSAPSATVTLDPAVAIATHGIMDPAWVPSPASRETTRGERDGIRDSIDRPPRG